MALVGDTGLVIPASVLISRVEYINQRRTYSHLLISLWLTSHFGFFKCPLLNSLSLPQNLHTPGLCSPCGVPIRQKWQQGFSIRQTPASVSFLGIKACLFMLHLNTFYNYGLYNSRKNRACLFVDSRSKARAVK